jgi:hypothetical protein
MRPFFPRLADNKQHSAVTGHIADERGQYWAFVFLGYRINVVAVPALALVGDWTAVAVLIIVIMRGQLIARCLMKGHDRERKGHSPRDDGLIFVLDCRPSSNDAHGSESGLPGRG